jgi:hypothetical protein
MSAPPTPEPDLKDWTWVVHERCPDCGFDPAAVDRADVPDLTGRATAAIAEALAAPDAGQRPRPAVWSPLEYGCHVRDVCVLFEQRLHLMLDEDDPQFVNWDQDETALEQRYWEQEPATVARDLRAAADKVAGSFGAVSGAQWERPGRRSNGSVFTVDTLARYFLHDLAHHRWDVTGRQW